MLWKIIHKNATQSTLPIDSFEKYLCLLEVNASNSGCRVGYFIVGWTNFGLTDAQCDGSRSLGLANNNTPTIVSNQKTILEEKKLN